MPPHIPALTPLALTPLALTLLCGTALAQPSWQLKSRIEQTQSILHLSGANITIGQIELSTGMRSHEAFADGVVDRIDTTRITDPTHINDEHATLVAGILAGSSASFKGAAPAARLQWADWTETAPNDPRSLSNDFLAKMRFFLASPQAQVVNISASINRGHISDPPAQRALTEDLNSKHQRIADWSVTQGLLFVASSSNDGLLGSRTIASPATGFNVLTVGATGNPALDGRPARTWDQVSDFSGRGPVDQNFAGGGALRIKPDLVAPGYNIRSATTPNINSYSSDTGTSFAAPQVAGTAAMLHELAAGNTLATDPRTMRAVLMNSTNKTARASDGRRWDELGLGKGTLNMSLDLGTGRLDALAAARQLAAGRGRNTIGNNASGVGVANVGWDLGTLDGEGYLRSNDYTLINPLRKGSYITATLVWNRAVTGGTPNAEPGELQYDALNDLDLGVSKINQIGNLVEISRSINSATEHLVYKIGNTDNDRVGYHVRAWQASHNTMYAGETYAIAWRSVLAPLAGGAVITYNGDFNPGLGAPVDDGWYKLAGVPRIGERPWSPPDAVTGYEDAAYAMELHPSDIMAQELVTPGAFFDIRFNYGFTAGNGAIQVLLNGINLLQYDTIAGDTLAAADGTLNTERTYTARIDLTANPMVWAAMQQNPFTEISFAGFGGGNSYIDNITYVPTPGLPLTPLTLLALTMRRRRA